VIEGTKVNSHELWLYSVYTYWPSQRSTPIGAVIMFDCDTMPPLTPTQKGDVIYVIEKPPMGIWTGKLNSKVGSFKFIYVDGMPEESPPVQRKRTRTWGKTVPARAKHQLLEDVLDSIGLRVSLHPLLYPGESSRRSLSLSLSPTLSDDRAVLATTYTTSHNSNPPFKTSFLK